MHVFIGILVACYDSLSHIIAIYQLQNGLYSNVEERTDFINSFPKFFSWKPALLSYIEQKVTYAAYHSIHQRVKKTAKSLDYLDWSNVGLEHIEG